MGCSENYLSGVFQRVVGQRLNSYLTGLRVDAACRALIESDRAIKAISPECGFAGSRQLARVFGQRVGVSPSAYRRIFRGC